MQERPLGCWESGFHSAHDKLSGTMLVVGCADFDAAFDFDKIHRALELLFECHPLLRATIETRTFNPFFVLNNQFSNIPIQVASNQDWQEQFEREIHQPLESNTYLWRIVLQPYEQGFRLFLITHHAILDAISQINFIEQFMELYNQLLLGNKPSICPLPFLSNIEANLKETFSWTQFQQNYDEIANAIIDQIAYEENRPIQDRKSTTNIFVLENKKLALLLKACKKRKVTLNSLLNAIMLKTQAVLRPGLIHACVKTPVNLRNYCEPKLSEKHLGCYLSIVETMHMLSNDTVWALAQEYQTNLYSAIPRIGFLPREIDHNEVDIGLVTNLFAVTNARRRKSLPNTFGVSNIGRVTIKGCFEKIKLKDYVFNTNHLIGNYYMFLSALTLYDELKLVFAYVTPLITEASAKEFIELYLHLLDLESERAVVET